MKTGDRVKIVDRKVTDEDRKQNRYFEHMANLTGTVQNVYGKDEVAVRVDPSKMSDVTEEVHQRAIERMRKNFLESISEEAKKQMSSEELNFTANFVLLVREDDLERE